MCRNKDEQNERDEGPSSLLYSLATSSNQRPIVPIREQIRQGLLTKLNEMEQSGRLNKSAQPVAQRPTECMIQFKAKETGDLVDSSEVAILKQKYHSLTSRHGKLQISAKFNAKYFTFLGFLLKQTTSRKNVALLRNLLNLRPWFENQILRISLKFAMPRIWKCLGRGCRQ